ncbi:TPA: diiron oxygenase [Pseudomonas putida]|nr:diiron oxygenase [Pseudomonas putida]
MKKNNRSNAVFRNWHLSSAVRSRPYAYGFSSEDFAQAEPSLWFPAVLSSALSHEALKNLPKSELLSAHVHHLVYFMDYTTELEIAHVNQAVRCMVSGSLEKYFNEDERRIALKLYADEGYHALFSREISDQVANHFGLVRMRSARIERLDQVLKKSPLGFRCLTKFCVAFVSETLITHELYKLSRASLVVPVAHMLNDHLHDEGRHAIFFSDCFVRLWWQIHKREKDYVVQMLLEVLAIFGRPDASFLHLVFKSRPALCVEVFDYLESNWTKRMPEISEMTLRAIQATDLLDDESYFLQFKAAGLIP